MLRRNPAVRCLILLLIASTAYAAPPTFDPPSELVPVGEYVTFAPAADCVSAKYIGLDGISGFPLELVGGSKTVFFLPTRGLPKGRYKFVGVASSATGEQVDKPFVVVVGNAPVTPPPDKPPVDPPDKPPVTGSLYFLIVRPDGPAHPIFTAIMSNAAWGELRAKGHLVKDRTVTEARTLGANIPAGIELPCVITLRVSADGKKSTVIRPAMFLPPTTTSETILALTEGL